MRYGCKINHLSRTHSLRAAMLSDMATSLIMHKRIETMLAKAKVLRVYVNPLMNRSKEDTTHNRRIVFSYLHSKEAVNELFREISQKVANRPGGYTRIQKTDILVGDNSTMAIIELVDYNENMLKDNTAKKAKSTRRSRSKKAEAPVAEAFVAESHAAEAPKAE